MLFRVNQVVWVRLEDNYWPGVIREVCPGALSTVYEVSFIDNDQIEEERAAFEAKDLIDFQSHQVQENTELTNLFRAYLTAKKKNQLFLAHTGNSEAAKPWKFKELKNCIDDLMINKEIPADLLAKVTDNISSFEPRKDFAAFYVRESICCRISLVLKERELDPVLRDSLLRLKTKFINLIQEELIFQNFMAF